MTTPDDAATMAAFLDEDLGAVTITWSGNDYLCYYTDEYLDQLGMETQEPMARVLTSEFSAITHGETVTIEGTTYVVRGIEPNGTGFTMLRLETQ